MNEEEYVEFSEYQNQNQTKNNRKHYQSFEFGLLWKIRKEFVYLYV